MHERLLPLVLLVPAVIASCSASDESDAPPTSASSTSSGTSGSGGGGPSSSSSSSSSSSTSASSSGATPPGDAGADAPATASGKCGFQGDPNALAELKTKYPDVWRNDYQYAHIEGHANGVYDGFKILDSTVFVASDKVTLKNFYLKMNGAKGYYPVRTDDRYGGQGSVIRDGTVTATNATDDGPYKGVLAAVNGMSILNMDISGTHDGISIGADNVTVDTVCIHDLAVAPTAHNDGIEIYGGKHIVIRNATIDNQNGQTSAINITNDYGPIDDVTIENSTLSGGGYTIYVRGDGASAPAKVTNIHFKNVTVARPGSYGVVSFQGAPGAIVTWDVKDKTGKAIPKP